ncbi:MAG: GH32 C-terminal domain-containing protein, partial [Pseudomonadota bacterium]|nr:GH32 C-terminal domain-containing protein [Pseudomonadota bacterium]
RPAHLYDIDVPADADLLLDGVSGDSLELFVEMDSADASEFGIKVCVAPNGEEETIIAYSPEQGGLSVDTRQSGPPDSPKAIETAPFSLDANERLRLRIFIDKSVIEVFANDRQAVARRIYPARSDSLGVSLFAVGGIARVHVLESWLMSPSNPY